MLRIVNVLVSVLVLVVVEALLLLATADRAMRLLGVPVAVYGPVGPVRSAPLPPWATHRVRAALGVLRRARSSDTCLRRSLLLAVMLRPLHPVVRLGWVPQPGGGFAHAWVEVAGESLEAGLDEVIAFQGGDAALNLL